MDQAYLEMCHFDVCTEALMTKKYRIAAIAAATGVIIGITSAGAMAGYSSWSSMGSHHGISYQERSYSGASSTPYGGAQIQASPSAPAGYMGMSAYLYNYSALCASATTVYNSVTLTVLARSASGDCGSGNYRARGVGKAYNYDGSYYPQWTYYSPYYTW